MRWEERLCRGAWRVNDGRASDSRNAFPQRCNGVHLYVHDAKWGYSHTNYVILGRLLEKITRMSLAEAMQKYIFDPMDLKETQSFGTPQIPEPVLHAFSSKRRADLRIPCDSNFYEESTFWNPS